jgi:hypothetical protein
MTLASALFSTGGALPYISDVVYPISGLVTATSGSGANEDWITAFVPRRTVTVDGVAWQRDNTSAANVYVGIYSADGTLLTDCAVDADTTSGMHVVSTTQVTLTQDNLYYFAWNASADCAQMKGNTSQDNQFLLIKEYGVPAGLSSGAGLSGFTSYSKSRTNAALLSSLTMSGFTAEIPQVNMGFRVA